MNPVTILASDCGPALHRSARIAATVAAYLITLALLGAELAYALGCQLRLALEARNDQLAAWWVGVLGLRPAVVPPAAAPEAPAVLPLKPIALLCPAPVDPAPQEAKRRAPKRKTAAPKAPPKAKVRSKAPATRRKAATA